jgi:hypothetical protein
MRARRHTAAVVFASALTALVTGCGSDSSAKVDPGDPGDVGASSPRSSPVSNDAFVMLRDGDRIGTEVSQPPAAKPDATGATEFATWYLNLFEYAPKAPGPQTISEVAADCDVCMDGVRDWKRQTKQGITSAFSGPVTFRGPVSRARNLGDGRTAVSLLVDEPAYQLTRHGKVLKTYDGAKNRQFTLTLAWKDQQWRVVDLARLDPGATS